MGPAGTLAPAPLGLDIAELVRAAVLLLVMLGAVVVAVAAALRRNGSPDKPQAHESAPVPERLRPLLAAVADLIVAGDLEGLRGDPRIVLADPDDPLYWVRDYPATVVPIPEEGWGLARASIMPDGRSWYVTVELWTAEEGRSDLTLEAEIREEPDGLVIEV